MICSHIATGRVSSAPIIYPTSSGMISWNLKYSSSFHGKKYK
jgi:hypothetical protein